jgi:hypothetical protein
MSQSFNHKKIAAQPLLIRGNLRTTSDFAAKRCRAMIAEFDSVAADTKAQLLLRYCSDTFRTTSSTDAVS